MAIDKVNHYTEVEALLEGLLAGMLMQISKDPPGVTIPGYELDRFTGASDLVNKAKKALGKLSDLKETCKREQEETDESYQVRALRIIEHYERD